VKEDYAFIEKMLSSTRDDQHYFFNELLLSDPIQMRAEYRERRVNNYKIIQTFYLTLKDLFKDLLISDEKPDLLNLLLNDSQEKLPLSFHKNLPECAWTIPIFFRTDESYNAKIFEIQNPGSGWADPIILYRFYKEYKNSTCLNIDSNFDILDLFIKDVIKITGCEEPSIMHLLDSSSNPCMMRYFISITSNPINIGVLILK
jgi:hypothetical protein